MSSTDTSSTETSPKFLSKDWFLKNKVLVGVVVVVILVGAGVGIYFAVKPKSSSDANNDQTAGGTDTGTPKNGRWSEWSTECVKQGNQWVKTRTCLEEGKNGGLLCSQIDGGKSTRVCDPIAGQWRTPSDSESVCKLENGVWVKERFCDNPAPKYGGAECAGSNKVSCTPTNGYWFPSINDAVCEVEKDENGNIVTDGQGRTKYYKTLTCVNGQFGGEACPTRTESGVVIKDNKAMIPCSYRDGTWTEFSTCQTSGNDVLKTRRCTLPELGGLPCVDYYPLLNLVANSDSGYVVRASSVDQYGVGGAYEPWNAFDASAKTYWHSADSGTANIYTGTTGVYTGAEQTVVGSKVYRGEWIQIQFPPNTIHTPFRAVGIRITPRDDSTDVWTRRSPRNFVLLGSQNGTSWTVIYDNTLLDGIKDWTSSRKTIYFPTPASMGYMYYRLVITRVGNFDTGTDMKSVQIADLRIIGTPIVPVSTDPTIPTTQTTETIPCNRDCLYGDWGNCSYDTTNNKWIQTRSKTDPVGSGTACNPSQITRNCPNTEAWSDWGAFKVNNVSVAAGTPEQFEKGKTYFIDGVEKQIRYAKPTGAKGCPNNVNADSKGMCYDTPRDYWNDWGPCSIQSDGSFKRTRTNKDNGTIPQNCDNNIYKNDWKQLKDVAPKNFFKIKNRGRNDYIGVNGNLNSPWDWDHITPKNQNDAALWYTTINNSADRGNQFRRLSFVQASNNRCMNVLGFCPGNQSWNNDILVRGCQTSDNSTNDRNFHYDPVSKQITNNNSGCENSGGKLLCLERVDNSIRTRWCDSSNINQRWDFESL
jgi:hypothetical protein